MPRATLRDLSRLFLKLGIFGFGGPAAHIATMEEEVVQRKHWLSDEYHGHVHIYNAGGY